MHILVVNSVAGLLAVLQEQISCTPTHAVIHSWADPDAVAAVPDARSNTTAAAADDTNKKVTPRRFRNHLLRLWVLCYMSFVCVCVCVRRPR